LNTTPDTEHRTTEATNVPDRFLALCREDVVRISLTSLSLKLELMRERGFKDLHALHAWMKETHEAFVAAAGVQSAEARTVPDSFLEVCREELARFGLTSLPLKLQLMRERGFKDVDEVHAWMRATHEAFVAATNAARPITGTAGRVNQQESASR
jgi:hypothetical protein